MHRVVVPRLVKTDNVPDTGGPRSGGSDARAGTDVGLRASGRIGLPIGGVGGRSSIRKPLASPLARGLYARWYDTTWFCHSVGLLRCAKVVSGPGWGRVGASGVGPRGGERGAGGVGTIVKSRARRTQSSLCFMGKQQAAEAGVEPGRSEAFRDGVGGLPLHTERVVQGA